MDGAFSTVFFSYARQDAAFALRLAKDLRSSGVDVWIDQLDIEPGVRWDQAVEAALKACPCMLVVLSPASVASENVQDEVSYAMGESKRILPVLAAACEIPFRWRRLQLIDSIDDYAGALHRLLAALGPKQNPHLSTVAALVGPSPPKESVSLWGAYTTLVAGWSVGGAFGLWLAFNLSPYVGQVFAAGFGWSLAGLIGGVATAKALQSNSLPIDGSAYLMLATGCAAGGGIGGALSWSAASVLKGLIGDGGGALLIGGLAVGGVIGGAVGGGIGGFVAGSLLPSNMRRNAKRMCSLFWAIGGGLGGALSWAFLGFQYNGAFYALDGLLTGAVSAVVGGGGLDVRMVEKCSFGPRTLSSVRGGALIGH